MRLRKQEGDTKTAILNADPSVSVKDLAKELGTSKEYIYRVRREADQRDEVRQPSKKVIRRKGSAYMREHAKVQRQEGETWSFLEDVEGMS